MEQSIGSIVAKIDTVLVKLDYMEKNRSKRKAAMSKILGTITEDDGSESRNLDSDPLST
jgi:polycystin 2